MKNLKKRWGITSNFRFVMIIITFALTGSISVKLARPLLDFLGAGNWNAWLYWPIRILVIFPLYQVMLIIIGTLLGQFRFFWNFEKKILKRFGLNFK